MGHLLRAIVVLAAIYVASALGSPQNATTFSMVYGIPLGAFVNTYLRINDTNTYLVSRTFASPADDKSFVRPNADVLYTSAIWDTCISDILLTAPTVPDGRFWDISFWDPYGDNFDNTGSLFDTPPGYYVLSRDPKPSAFYSNHTNGAPVARFINTGNTQGAIAIRLFAANTTEDLTVAHTLQDGFTISTVPRPDIAQPKYCFTNATLLDLGDDQATKTMRLTARLAGHNTPLNASDTLHVAEQFKLAGIDTSAKTYSTPAGVDLNAAWTAAQDELEGYPHDNSNFEFPGNGWVLPVGEGAFESNYVARAFVAVTGPWVVNETVAMYPQIDKSFILSSDEAMLVTFSGRPPVDAFWSLTMYDSAGEFVANPVNHFALGSSHDLTFPDGSLVYKNGTATDVPDGVFQLLIQSAETAPPANWTENWLPSPGDGSNFTVNLRWYGPTPALSDGIYTYPIMGSVIPALAP